MVVNMNHSVINKLEAQVVNLADAYKKIRAENDELRNKQAVLNKEKRHLEELNKAASEKIKKIVHKIKMMEN